MGMELKGMNPKSRDGEHLRVQIDGWIRLAEICLQVAPAETPPCKYWGTNDGDGLDGQHSELLAQRLEEALADGSIDAYVADRLVSTESKPGNILVITLELRSDYRRTKDIVPIFIHFLRMCGGFRIW
jgi:hypothetical protein